VFRLRIVPKEEKFFEDFISLADRIVSGATLLERMLSSDPPTWDTALQIRQIEQECDSLTHQIIQRLNKTFVTPIDREDIHQLATSLDDVMDAIDASAAIVRLYQIEHVRADARELAKLVRMSADQVVIALQALERKRGVAEPAVEINRLENEADRAHQASLRRLFEEERDPITIIKWKEILDFLEDATDRCEDVANVLEGVVVKHA
jgi:predicted phosphate transport protein (TIGR00153 family)